MIVWDKLKSYLRQNQKVAMNLPAYSKDVHDYDGDDFPEPSRGFKCNVDGWYSIYYSGMVGETPEYVPEYCVAGVDYAGYIINIKTDAGTPAVIAEKTITVKW